MFWVKVFHTRYDLLVAVCDEDLIDKELKIKTYKIKVSKNFYGGKLVSEKIALILMKKATIGNLFGKQIIKVAIENGFIADENIILINGTPHAQYVKII